MGEKTNKLNFSIKKEITLSELVELMLDKLKWIILTGIICGLLMGIGVKLFVTPMYRSFTSLYVHNDAGSMYEKNDSINGDDLIAAENLANTYVNILQRNVVLDDVLEHYKETSKKPDKTLSRIEISKMLSVSIVDNTQLIEIAIKSDDPVLSYEVAHSFSVVASKKLETITKAGGVYIVDKAEKSEVPVSPQVLLDAVVGAIVSMVAVVFYFLLRTLSDNTIYLAEDITTITDVPIFGSIPNIKIDDVTDDPQWRAISSHIVSQEEVFVDEQ